MKQGFGNMAYQHRTLFTKISLWALLEVLWDIEPTVSVVMKKIKPVSTEKQNYYLILSLRAGSHGPYTPSKTASLYSI